MAKVDAKRIGKNFGYFVRSLSSLDESLYVDKAAAKAVIKHHFDNHCHCGPWCKRRNMSKEERNHSLQFYHDKEDKHDLMFYNKLLKIVSKYITPP